MKIKRKRIMASSGNIRLSYSGGNKYFATYTVYDGRDKIGLLEDHHTGVKNPYYIAWHLYGNPGPNQAGNTKMFYSKDEAIQWIIDNLGKGDLRKEVGASTKTRKTSIKADAADVYENGEFEQYCVYDADTLEIIDVLEDKDSAIARADEYRRKHPRAYVAIDYQIVDEDGELLSDDDNSVIYAPDPVESSTRTRKTPIKADAADVGEIRDQQYVEDFFYDIEINGNPLGTYYKKLEDAIEIAQQYASDPQYADDEIAVVIRHQLVDDVAGEVIDYFDDDGAAEWRSDDYLYESTNITCAADANGYEDLALALGDAIKKLAADEDHLNNFISYLTQHFPEWLRKYANTPDGLVSEFREFANMNF